MKWKILSIFIILILAITFSTGCFHQNTVEPKFHNRWYSNDNETVLICVSDTSEQTLVNTIDELYDNGYEYIGDVQLPYNLAGKMDFYLLFRINE